MRACEPSVSGGSFFIAGASAKCNDHVQAASRWANFLSHLCFMTSMAKRRALD
jgi:hypothetical protein